jgi:hypothetical protein
MFILHTASDPVPCYQTTRGALYTARRLTEQQWGLLTRCDGRAMTLADLVRATRLPAEEVAATLDFLRAHGLMRALYHRRPCR